MMEQHCIQSNHKQLWVVPLASTFSERLTQACDDSELIPAPGEGRQVTLARRLGVSQEAVRKWFADESKPRPAVMRELAKLLEVDEAWLTLGVAPELDRAERRELARNVDGAVMLVMGLLELAGGKTAQPGEKDKRRAYVDFYAIHNGVQFAVHVSLGREISPGQFELTIPREYREVRTIGVVKGKNGRWHKLNMLVPLIEKHKARKGGDFVVRINANGAYVSGDTTWPQIKNFEEFH